MAFFIFIFRERLHMPQLDIHGYHIHVYFDQSNIDYAIALTESVHKEYGYELGRINKKPVGPHPVWSRQVSFKQENYDVVLAYLTQHQNGLSILIHPLTDDEYLDHTQSAVWLGTPLKLDISIFTKK